MESYTIMQNVLNEILTMPEILTNKFMQNNLNKDDHTQLCCPAKGQGKDCYVCKHEEIRDKYKSEIINHVSQLNLLNLKTIVDNELKKRENIADGTSLWDKLPAHIQIYILQQKKISEEKAVNFMIKYEKELKKLQKNYMMHTTDI